MLVWLSLLLKKLIILGMTTVSEQKLGKPGNS